MDWKELVVSPAAISVYVTVVLFVYRSLQIKYKWDTERYEGLITSIFLTVEKAGCKTGNEKLDMGVQLFTQKFKDTYGKPPSTKDLQDAALDFARKAFELKFQPKPGL